MKKRMVNDLPGGQLPDPMAAMGQMQTGLETLKHFDASPIPLNSIEFCPKFWTFLHFLT